MIHNLLAGKPLPLYGDGKNVRDWLYVDDHCTAIDMILEKGQVGEIYNIGGGNEWKNIDLINLLISKIRELLPTNETSRHIDEKVIQFVEDRKGHDRRYAIDSSKIQRELGWQPTVPFKEGLVKTIQWYMNQGLPLSTCKQTALESGVDEYVAGHRNTNL
ncbi:hypothetical protein skT53_28090 [Effusibacillus dendaii]|uniref:NAD(P)-binding domain-containing protein n=1 Tax=Effusibacillus dendaii TaxID=2743772 RepID=A0A7I8DCL8_9BACL|nr:hypothetical protein skT53_28090 [Effusibacillus dendaii]